MILFAFCASCEGRLSLPRREASLTLELQRCPRCLGPIRAASEHELAVVTAYAPGVFGRAVPLRTAKFPLLGRTISAQTAERRAMRSWEPR